MEEVRISPPEAKAEPRDVVRSKSDAKPDDSKFRFEFLKTGYVDEIGCLATSIHAFRWRLDELQDHLHFIDNAIDIRSKQDPSRYTETSIRNPSLTRNAAIDASKAPAGVSSRSHELQHHCETMCGRGLRKYVVSHLTDIGKLRDQVPLALKCAPNSSKLVFDSIGRFYIQGSKAFSIDSPLITARQAAVLILEFFLLSGAVQTQTEPSIKAEANSAAIEWRKRLINEGGFSTASEIDTRGLLLFIAAFGIPTPGFTKHDVRDLIHFSNSKEISKALRRSHSLLVWIPDIIEGMIKNGMNIEAVDVAYTFGVEDKFPPHTILTSFLQKCTEAWKRTKKDGNGSPVLLKEAYEKHLASLKSLSKCSKDHSIDLTSFLPKFNIKEQITNLEKDIADLVKKIKHQATTKRKAAAEIDFSKKTQEIKRPRFSTNGSSPRLPPQVISFHEQRPASSQSSYLGLMHLNSYHDKTSLPVPYGSSLDASVPENARGSVLVGGIEAAIAAGIGPLSNRSFRGVQREMLLHVDNSAHQWHGIRDVVLNGGQDYSGQITSMGIESSYVPNPASVNVSNQRNSSDLYQFADAVLEL